MKNAVTYLIVIILLASCNSNKQVSSNNSVNNSELLENKLSTTDEKNIKVEDTLTKYSFVVSFTSRGEGINGTAKNSFDDLIKEFELKNKVKINFKLNYWGREGETEYCFDLNNLNSIQRNNFVSQAKELLKSADLVGLTENKNCR